MDNDFNDKIKEIGNMFGISEMPDNIGDIVSSLLTSSSESSAEKSEPEEQTSANAKTEQSCMSSPDIGHTNKKTSSSDFLEDIDIAKVLKLLNKYKEAKKNKEKDKKIQLLYAVEPFLNEKRKDKVNNCVKFLTFADLAKEFKDI
ncbi:MAG: hypothetical protein KIC77_02550 [Clostridiales bacterium]|jgi:hypothetical protein|nr:hypothetical protein [Clostridiales bacterium]